MKLFKTITKDMPLWALAKTIEGMCITMDALSYSIDVYLNRYQEEDQPLIEFKEDKWKSFNLYCFIWESKFSQKAKQLLKSKKKVAMSLKILDNVIHPELDTGYVERTEKFMRDGKLLERFLIVWTNKNEHPCWFKSEDQTNLEKINDFK